MMTDKHDPTTMTAAHVLGLFPKILGPEKDFYILAVVYGAGISLLSLALPISVQMLINTVANTGLPQPLVVLSLTLFGLLLVSGLLRALRIHLMEIFGRRFYARMVSDIALRTIYSRNPFFYDAGRGPLFNRYFDIVIVQKTVPYLLVGGFTIILQAAVGFVVVSLYHPYFLVLNLVFILLMWVIWLVWGGGAVRSSVALSHRKHAAAAWIEGLAAANGFYKSERHVDHALNKTEEKIHGYVGEHKRHFRRHFAQTLGFFVLYAAASAILLGLGGFLVIQGQLTIGQLVAAELILSAVFFGVSQLGGYLMNFYDLCAAVEEISQFYDVEQEEIRDAQGVPDKDSSLSFNNVRGDARGRSVRLDFTVPHGVKALAVAKDHGLQRLFTDLLKRHAEPRGGYIEFGGVDIEDIDVHALRRRILILDRPTIVECTVREYLRLAGGDPKPSEILDALEIVGLNQAVSLLNDGLDTSLASTGWPLSIVETMELKLAGAILAKPGIVIMSQLFDIIPESNLTDALRAFDGPPASTVIYFSNRGRDLGYDGVLRLGETTQAYEPGLHPLARENVRTLTVAVGVADENRDGATDDDEEAQAPASVERA